MKFDNLALTGWSYEKADKEIPMEDLLQQGLPKRIQSRNPVPSTWVYSDEAQWEERLANHVKQAVETANLTPDEIEGFWGVHNGYQRHVEGASPVVMTALDNPMGFMADFNLGCASVILASQMAGLHFYDENMHNAVVGMVQMNTQYTNLCTDGNCIFADSIGAIVYSRKNSGNMIRYTEITSGSYFRDMFIIDENFKYQLKNIQKGRELTEFMVKSFATHLRNSCRILKVFPIDIDFYAISCSTHAASKTVLENLNFPLERSGLECMTKIPHMGTNDLLYQIEYGIEQGMIKKGSKILVSGTSLGFSAATMAIEWGVD